MQPITDPRALRKGATLYHSAFGFAQVDDVADDAVSLSWERDGGHLPRTVRFANLQRVYSMCGSDGFFHRALHDPSTLGRDLHERPAEALTWLLDDLAQPQRTRDVMDWLVGRRLFTAKTFVRWWGMAEAAIRADTRLRLDGEWLHRAEEDRAPLVQLAPDEVDAEAELDLDAPLRFDDDEDGPSLDRPSPFEPVEPISLAEARPPASELPSIGRALAESLARAHGEGQVVAPTSDRTILRPDGEVLFSDIPEPHEADRPELDLGAAAAVLLESAMGRGLPPGVEPCEILPFLRHRRPDLPPAALAPLVSALREDPEDRPTASAWADQWRAVLQADAERAEALDRAALLRAGYDTHVGHVKLMLTQINQDALHVSSRGSQGLYVIADGISIADAGRGDQASWLAVQALTRTWSRVASQPIRARHLLDTALHLANRAICEHARRAAGGDLTGRMPMGTTCTVALTRGNHVHLAWLGDSRAWLVGPWGVSQLTADDNVSGERFLAWCQADARSWSADGHALVRYLGHFDDLQEPAPLPAHHASLVLLPGERLVLTTDGITDYAHPHEAEVAETIRRITAEATSPAAAARDLVRLANDQGGGDNATAVVIEHAED